MNKSLTPSATDSSALSWSPQIETPLEVLLRLLWELPISDNALLLYCLLYLIPSVVKWALGLRRHYYITPSSNISDVVATIENHEVAIPLYCIPYANWKAQLLLSG